MDNALYDEMFQMESTHWWFAAKRRIVLELLRQFLDIPPKASPKVCDVGCGCGMTLQELAREGYDALGIDANDTALAYCNARGVRAVKGTLPDGLDLPPASVDAVLMLDVLEHLEQDQAAFRAALRLVRPGGLLICTVPAYRWLWTKRDEFHHHKRRYSVGDFKALLASDPSGRPILASHMNTLLFCPQALVRLTRRILAIHETVGDLKVPPLGLNRLLKWIFASERFALRRRIPLPFGLSLLAVVRKGNLQFGDTILNC